MYVENIIQNMLTIVTVGAQRLCAHCLYVSMLWFVHVQGSLNGTWSSWSSFGFCVLFFFINSFLSDELVRIVWKQNVMRNICTELGSDIKKIEKFT